MKNKISLFAKILILVTLSTLIYFSFNTGLENVSIAYNAGRLSGLLFVRVLILTLISFLAWRFLFKKDKAYTYLIFSLLFLATTIFDIKRIRERTEFSNFKEQITNVLLNEPNTTTQENKCGNSDYDSVLDFINQFKSDQIKLALDFSNSMAELDFENISSPEFLIDNEKISKFLLKLNFALEKVTLIEQNGKKYHEEFAEMLTSTSLKGDKKFYQEVKRGLDDGRVLFERWTNLSKNLLIQTDLMLTFIQANEVFIFIQDELIARDEESMIIVQNFFQKIEQIALELEGVEQDIALVNKEMLDFFQS